MIKQTRISVQKLINYLYILQILILFLFPMQVYPDSKPLIRYYWIYPHYGGAPVMIFVLLIGFILYFIKYTGLSLTYYKWLYIISFHSQFYFSMYPIILELSMINQYVFILRPNYTIFFYICEFISITLLYLMWKSKDTIFITKGNVYFISLFFNWVIIGFPILLLQIWLSTNIIVFAIPMTVLMILSNIFLVSRYQINYWSFISINIYFSILWSFNLILREPLYLRIINDELAHTPYFNESIISLGITLVSSLVIPLASIFFNRNRNIITRLY